MGLIHIKTLLIENFKIFKVSWQNHLKELSKYYFSRIPLNNNLSHPSFPLSHSHKIILLLSLSLSLLMTNVISSHSFLHPTTLSLYSSTFLALSKGLTNRSIRLALSHSLHYYIRDCAQEGNLVRS